MDPIDLSAQDTVDLSGDDRWTPHITSDGSDVVGIEGCDLVEDHRPRPSRYESRVHDVDR
jgi:hypothetical protein